MSSRPYGAGDQHTKYTPADEFTIAITTWVEDHQRRMRGSLHAPVQKLKVSPRDYCLRIIAERAGLNRAIIWRIADGEEPYLTLRQADRLAMALNIPLRCLAEEFKSIAKWEEEKQGKEVAA